MSKVPLMDNQDLQVHLAILWYLTELDIVSYIGIVVHEIQDLYFSTKSQFGTTILLPVRHVF